MPTNLDITDDFLKAMAEASTTSERSNDVLKTLKEQGKESKLFKSFVASDAKVVVSTTVELIDATIELAAAWQICSEKQDEGNLKNVQKSLDKLRASLMALNAALDTVEAKAKEFSA